MFKKTWQKDLELGKKFQKKFKKMIIGKDKKSGLLAVLFKSKSGAVLTVKTMQKEPQVLERKKDGD